MLLEEFDVDKYERTLREEEREVGIENVVKVINSITNSREIAKQQLMKLYGLCEEEAESKIELYWQL